MTNEHDRHFVQLSQRTHVEWAAYLQGSQDGAMAARSAVIGELRAAVEAMDTGNRYYYIAPGGGGMTTLIDKAAVLAVLDDLGLGA